MQTRERVEAAAEAAGLKCQLNGVQLLGFGEHLNSQDLKLMELNDDVLEELRLGRSVVIRGQPSDDAVVCTEKQTYELKLVETSNTLLLAPSLKTPKDPELSSYQDDELVPSKVTSCFSHYLELRPCRPKLERVKHILLENPFCGAEGEETSDDSGQKVQGYTYDALLDRVQASESELQEGLERLDACCMDGGEYRILDPDYRDRVLQRLFSLLEEEDWSFKAVPLERCCSLLAELEPRMIVEHCLKMYGSYRIADDGDVVCDLCEEKVCRFFAELLLRAGRRFAYQDFLDTWQQSVPIGMITSLDHLKGLALINLQSMPPEIAYFPVADLPEDPAARFNKLFKTKEKWSLEEIQPYIKDLETPTQSINALLLKFARVSTGQNGMKLFNSKRPQH